MNEKFLKPYNPQETEENIIEMWEKSGYANPDKMIKDGYTNPQAEVFSIVLPPPNVTGTLHTGHASMLAIEDIMVRYNRMLGKRTLWLPGTDHAAIATQSKVEKILAKEKIRKHDLGREEFLNKVHEFAQNSHDTIVSQCRRMGASLDWSREAFTLDKEREHAVYTAFTRMYNDGLIYRDYRIVNWDVKGQTVISDDEIVRQERDSVMYTFKYSKDFPISISTTRPETKVGDTAVAVHPDDERYKEFVGKTYSTNFCGSDIEVKIIADDHVDMELGTGALGVTVAHAIADWEIAQRHDIEMRQVINEYGKMENCGEILDGMKVAAARERVVEWLRKQDLLEHEEAVKQEVATAERTGGVIEPLPKLQWWIDTEKEFEFKTDKITGIKKGQKISLKSAMMHVVENGDIDILPERFKKTYYHWIGKLRPWNISRQIWYGHRIPVWYNIHDINNARGTLLFNTNPQGLENKIEEKNKIITEKISNYENEIRTNSKRCYLSIMESSIDGKVTKKLISACSFADASYMIKEGIVTWNELSEITTQANTDLCQNPSIQKETESIQDSDTLDTWFSSGLWTFSTLGWPNENAEDLLTYHPTNVLETGHDIIFFWVARMILMSLYHIGDVPFRTTYLHGLIRDAKGRKMSKSLGNIVDPVDLINKYSTDALRMAMIVGNGPGNDVNLDEQKIKAYSKFSNKLWNITRFILTETENFEYKKDFKNYSNRDIQILDEQKNLLNEITKEMNEFKYYLVSEKLYHYAWHELADKILEESKEVFENGTEAETHSRKNLLLHTLRVVLKTLHPFMPFVTEEIWQHLPKNNEERNLLMIELWPTE